MWVALWKIKTMFLMKLSSALHFQIKLLSVTSLCKLPLKPDIKKKSSQFVVCQLRLKGCVKVIHITLKIAKTASSALA